MRGLLLFLVIGLAGWGQTLSGLFGPQFERIIPYLGLTEGQLDQILDRGDAFQWWEMGRQERVYVVQAEIAAETARSPLEPMALGVRYAEVETIRREIAARRALLVPGNVALLTEEQRGKLGPLEAAMGLRGTWREAGFLGLVAGSCQTLEVCAGGWMGSVDDLRIVAAAQAYLGLGDEQARVLGKGKREFGEWMQTVYERAVVVQAGLAKEMERSPLDPMALGAGYVELEMMRREVEARGFRLVAANVTSLTEGQRGRLGELEAAMRLAEVGDEARVLQVLAPDCTVREFASLLLGAVSGTGSWCETYSFVAVP